ncbi:MAG: hypothetical protein IIZ36_02240, partial [Ruminococcus sp.]|nr:hypothetical protein [Ruminococcus sp.]
MDKTNKSTLIQDIYELTPLQEGMLYHHLADPDSTAYILQNMYTVDFELHEDLLKKALELLSARYDVLRTVVLYQKIKAPKQIVLKKKEIELNMIDCSMLEKKE